MEGLTKRQFREEHGRAPWKSTFLRKKRKGDYLERLMNAGLLFTVDFSLAEQLLRGIPEATEEAAAFICYLSIASKEGHLCVKIIDNELSPSPLDLWKTIWMRDHSMNDHSSDLEQLSKLIHLGAFCLPHQLVTVNPTLHQIPQTPLVICDSIEKKLIYFQKHWNDESLCLRHFKRISESTPEYLPDRIVLKEKLEKLKEEKILLSEQADAVWESCLSSLMVLVGGPGTGKTYTAGWIVKLICDSLLQETQDSFQIALAAPTGKAAANLQHSFAKILTHQPPNISITSSTLHRLLKLQDHAPSSTDLSADLIIVDESSMIDVRTMSLLLSRVKPGARLILLGDSRQLPPVESGLIFSDLIQLHDQTVNKAGKVELKSCLRAELQEIVQFADCIKNRQIDQVFHLLDSGSTTISQMEFNEKEQIFHQQKAFVKKSSTHYFSKSYCNNAPEELLRHFQRYRILSPLKKGLFGVETLNHLIAQQVMQESAAEEWLAAPIMVVANDERLGLFNGDVGVLRKSVRSGLGHLLDFEEGDEAFFANGSQIRQFPAVLLPRVDLAYCLSVHKSQGSEFEHVVMVVPEGSEVFGCELFYTGVTRAKRKLEIYGNRQIIKEVLSHSLVRLSGICDRSCL